MEFLVMDVEMIHDLIQLPRGVQLEVMQSCYKYLDKVSCVKNIFLISVRKVCSQCQPSFQSLIFLPTTEERFITLSALSITGLTFMWLKILRFTLLTILLYSLVLLRIFT